MGAQYSTLPSSWRVVELRALCKDFQPGFARQPNDSDNGTLQLRMPSISRSGYIDFAISKYVDTTEVEQSKYGVHRGDVIFNNTNSPELVGNAAVFDHDVKCVLSNHMTRIRVNDRVVLPSYLAAVLHSYWRTGQTQRRAKQWINQAAIDVDNLARFRIPLPPLSEQWRIVEFLQEAEEVRRLRVAAETKTAELIQAMFEGEFGDPVLNTRKWDVEPLSSLINDTPKNGLYKPAELYGEGTSIIRIGDFTGGILRSSRNLQRVRITEEEIEQFGVSNGQILINRVNSIEHLGKSLLVASLTEPTVYESNMMRLDPNMEKVLPDYLIACIQHASIVAKLRAKAKKAINQASINQTDVLTLQIPVPSLKTQEQFALQVAQAEELRSVGELSLMKERAMSASLSAYAFSGQLTADWREANQARLAGDILMRDATLKDIRPRSTVFTELTVVYDLRGDGIYSDLNREQQGLLNQIERLVGDVPSVHYFTAQQLSEYITDGPLRRNPQAIEGHLSVFAIRGIIIPVSREEQTEDTGEFVFGNAYRLPLKDSDPKEDSDSEQVIGDHERLRELVRLAAQLERERSLK